MHVTFRQPWSSYEIGAVATLPDQMARDLIREEIAVESAVPPPPRPVPPPPVVGPPVRVRFLQPWSGYGAKNEATLPADIAAALIGEAIAARAADPPTTPAPVPAPQIECAAVEPGEHPPVHQPRKRRVKHALEPNQPANL